MLGRYRIRRERGSARINQFVSSQYDGAVKEEQGYIDVAVGYEARITTNGHHVILRLWNCLLWIYSMCLEYCKLEAIYNHEAEILNLDNAIKLLKMYHLLI